MNIGLWLIIIVGGALGIVSTLYLIVSMIGMIAYKVYRKCKYHTSLYD